MRIRTFATTIALALVATMAVAQTVTYDYDRTADFSKFHTYAWTKGNELSDELNHARVTRAIDAELAAKGLTKVDPSSNPDALVAYHASFDRNLEINASSSGWGPYGLGGLRSGRARAKEILVGTLTVDLIDARTNAIVWRGIANRDVNQSTKPEARDKNVTKAAQKMFKNYPPRS